MNEANGQARCSTLRTFAAAGLLVASAGLLVGCGLWRVSTSEIDGGASEIASAAGWTRMAASQHYLFVVNVLPGEEMFSHAAHEAHHPTEGELVIDGEGLPLGPNVRHVEAHVYDLATGLAISKQAPIIELTNRTTGEVTQVPAALMHDVNIGALDLHFGNNVHVAPSSDISVKISLQGEEVSVDGHLD
jgi:hypothetical protein